GLSTLSFPASSSPACVSSQVHTRGKPQGTQLAWLSAWSQSWEPAAHPQAVTGRTQAATPLESRHRRAKNNLRSCLENGGIHARTRLFAFRSDGSTEVVVAEVRVSPPRADLVPL